MIKKISRWIFEDVWGWSVSGTMPKLPKYLLVVAPHTSNWDFLVGLLYRAITDDFNPKYVGKKELFVWPIGYLSRALGGYPVERSKNTNFVDTMVSVYNSNEEFITTITPEGTRKYNEKWKTGFLRIARKNNCVIQLGALDFGNKRIVLGPVFEPTGDNEADIAAIIAYYQQFSGKYPDQF